MNPSLQHELAELVEEVVPSLIDLDQLQRLVAADDDPLAFDGECDAHDGCRPVFATRLP